MKKLTFTAVATVMMLSFSLLASAQEQPVKKRQFFSLADQKILTELEVTAEQKANMEAARNRFRVLRSKFELAIRKNDTLVIKRQDSVITTSQKQKVAELRQVIDADGKPNPWYRKSLIPFDAKVIEELAITPEQKQKFTSIQRDYNNERRKVNEVSAKVTADSILEQESVLNDTQKKKMAEMKAAILEHNNSIK